MKNTNGEHVPIRKRAEAIAEYLETDHWHDNGDRIPLENHTKIINRLGMDTSDYIITELDDALKTCKKQQRTRAG